MIGDAPWDCRSATGAGLPCLAVLTGGYSRAELDEAGATAVFEDLVELGRDLERLFLPGLATRSGA